jgi:hypothetical protein
MSEDQAEGARPKQTWGLRGRAKRALILDLASGDSTYDVLGPRHGLSHQGVVQFVARNREDIEAAKRDMTSELAGIWHTDKPLRLTDAMQDLDAVNEQLEDPNLTVTQRKGLWNLKIRLRHSIADECGQLLTRQVLQVESPEPFRTVVEGWSPDKWMEQLLNRDSSPAPEAAAENAANLPSKEADTVGNPFRVMPPTPSDSPMPAPRKKWCSDGPKPSWSPPTPPAFLRMPRSAEPCAHPD